ncbi:Uncharacterized protein GBIM_12844 [Gryllus bimaculatus]|nr:Uncharacterized protein GBIM_12844 [Gryllus bimaculatus]
MKKVQKIFDRRKPKNTKDGDSVTRSSEDSSYTSTQIEDGLEVNEDKPPFSPGNSTESSPEPLEVFPSSEDENSDYFIHHRETNRRRKTREMKQNKTSSTVIRNHNGDQEGACGPLVADYKNGKQVVPYCKVSDNVCQSVVLTSCGELEKTCLHLPLELQAKISVIKENLLREYPPFYDFCIIASDNDYDEAVRFKNYVASTFGLAGCTLDDGFISLGADLFDSYKMMMDQSTKVFFFVTENFTSSAFCKRLQSGAVFLSLMSKAQKDKEKCVPVFPHGFCMAPLALSGIAGLNPTQRDVTRRSLDNTYSVIVRQRRLVSDREHFKKRCLQFHVEVTKCIEEAKFATNDINSVQNNPSVMNLPDNTKRENVLASKAPPTPVIQMPENDELCRKTLDQCHIVESHCDLKSVEKVKNGSKKVESNRPEPTLAEKKVSVENETKEAKNIENGDDFDDDFLKTLPDEVRDAMHNSMPGISVNDCATVHIGNTIQIFINPNSSTDFSNLEHHINTKTTAFSGKETSENHSDSSD